MEKDRLDSLIGEELKRDVCRIRMSESLKDSIREKTIKKNKSFYSRFKSLMNTTIEIPVPSVMAACILICFLAVSTFTVTDSMKKDKSIQGYTSIKVVRIGGMDVYMDNEDSGGVKVEKNKN